MMQFLRGPVAKLIFGGLLFAFLLFIALDFGGGGRFAGHQGLVASVGGENLPLAEYNVLLAQELDGNWAAVRDVLTPAEDHAIRQQVLDRLVDQTIAWQQARRLKVAYTPDDVEATIHSIPGFLNPQNGQFDPMRYQAALNRLGLPQVFFEKEQERAMSAGRLEGMVREAVRVTDLEVWLEYLRWHRRMRVALLKLPLAEAKAAETVSDDEVSAYWQNNKGEFQKPERVHIRHIVIAASQTAGPDALARAKAKMDSVLAQLKQGASFPDVARKMSDDGNTAPRGGDLGWRVHGELIPEYDKVVFGLGTGETSAVFKTQFGYHLIRCDAHRPEEKPSYEDVKGKIRDRIVTARARAKLAEQAARVALALKQAKDAKQGEDLQRGALLLGRKLTDLGWVKLGGARPAGLSATTFQDVVEALAGLEPGETTGVIETPDGYYLAQLLDEEHHKADEREFLKERAVIEPILLARKQNAAWNAWLAAQRAKTKVKDYLESAG